MNQKNSKNSEIKYDRDSIKEEEEKKENGFNCLLFEDKSGSINENMFKEKEINNSPSLDKHKNSIDLNMTGKKLHEFLNDDLIEAIDNDLMEPKEICDMSDSNSSNGCFEGSSEYTSKANSPEFNIKYPKILKDINMNLNIESSSDKNDSNNLNYNYSLNRNTINNNNIKENYEIKEEEDKTLEIEKEDINKIINNSNSNFASKFIPEKNNNIEDLKFNEKKESNFENGNNKKEKTNPLKNKFDEVEPIIMLSLANREEITKFPYEIRIGDWICLYCNNFNFSFRIKCNRCGLLRKSSNLLKNHKYFNNNCQYLDSFNNYNDGYYMNYNKNINYELNFDANNYYDNNNNL